VADVRIFTPAREMMFAGHPTIGTAWLLIDEDRAPAGGAFQLQEKVGAVPVRAAADGMLWLTTPPISQVRFVPAEDCARALGLAPEDLIPGVMPEVLTAGNPTLLIAVRSPEAVDRASLDLTRLDALRPPGTDPICTFVFAPTAAGAYSRMFAPEHGVVEDPATGSSTGPLGAYMKRHGLTPGDRFYSEQGTKMGRRSFLHVELDGELVYVGGHVTPLTEAIMRLP
jgi:trans-2,3-dihydro-3-hydroxyanthranilate isomerase